MALANTRDPRQAEQQLRNWLKTTLPDAAGIEVHDVQTPHASGMSNETLLFTASWTQDGAQHRTECVARVAPQGPGVFPSYDLSVEQRVMDALRTHTDVPVPTVLWMEQDTAVLGAPFLVMERLDGNVAPDDPPFTAAGWVLDLEPAQRAAMNDNALVALAQVHAADYRALGLEFLDRPELGDRPLTQEITTWRHMYEWAAAGESNPTIEAGFSWLADNAPGDDEPTVLCWGDARLGNLLVLDDMSISGVLDWEMVTLGSPELDLGWWLFLMRHHTEGIGLELPVGFPTPDQVVARYTELSGHRARHLDFYEIFAAVRLSIIMHRAGNLMIAGGMLPPDAPMKFNNPASQLLAGLIGAPQPSGTAQSFIGNRG